MNTYKRHRFPAEVISYAVWLYYRFNLSHRDIEDLIARAERGRRGIQTPELSYDDTMMTLKAICGPRKSDGIVVGAA